MTPATEPAAEPAGAIRAPYILGLGGTLRANSSTEQALAVALSHAAALGAETRLLGGEDLCFPMYGNEAEITSPKALAFLAEVRRADGIVLGAPAYHGGMSGLVKNAIDYLQELARDPAPYLLHKPVGLIATGGGWPGAIQTVSALRTSIHSLRGWPTPLGVPINSSTVKFDAANGCSDAKVADQLATLAHEVFDFAVNYGRMKRAAPVA